MARTSLSLRNQVLELINGAIGAGAKGIGYGPPRPALPENPATGTKLYELSLASPALVEPAADGTIAFAAIADGVAIADGTLTYFRVVTAGGTVVLDIPASELGNPGSVAAGNTIKATDLALQLLPGA